MRSLNLAILLWVMGARAWAADPTCGSADAVKAREQTLLTARGYDDALRGIRACLGEHEVDQNPLVSAFERLTPDTQSIDERTTAIASSLSLLRDAAVQREKKGVDGAAWQQLISELNREIAGTEAAQASRTIYPIEDTFWIVPKQENVTILDGTLDLFDTGCARGAASCPEYDSRKDVLRVMNLLFRLVGYANYPNYMAHRADARLLDDQWKGYFNEALPQYWWEVAFNGQFMDQECAKDSTGMQVGFCKVPESQFILLHPATSLQWVNGADNTDDLAPAFVVEVFGRNSWRWDPQLKDGVLYGQLGWSVIAAYSNPGGGKENWSYGLMVHKGRKLNLGVTTSGNGQYSILVNINLAEWAFANKEKYLDYLKALKKPNWQALL